MDKIAVFVGVDYHKDAVQVCVLDRDGKVLGNRSSLDDPGGVLEYVRKHGEVQGVVLESCEGAADFAEGLIAASGWSVNLAHPGYVHRLRQNPDKTDYSDASRRAGTRGPGTRGVCAACVVGAAVHSGIASSGPLPPAVSERTAEHQAADSGAVA